MTALYDDTISATNTEQPSQDPATNTAGHADAHTLEHMKSVCDDFIAVAMKAKKEVSVPTSVPGTDVDVRRVAPVSNEEIQQALDRAIQVMSTVAAGAQDYPMHLWHLAIANQ